MSLLMIVLQDHKYLVTAEVLDESWDLDESQLNFINVLMEEQKSEMKGNIRPSHRGKEDVAECSYTILSIEMKQILRYSITNSRCI